MPVSLKGLVSSEVDDSSDNGVTLATGGRFDSSDPRSGAPTWEHEDIDQGAP